MFKRIGYLGNSVARRLRLTTTSQIERLLDDRGYKIAETLVWGRVYRVEQNGKSFAFRSVPPDKMVVYSEVLPNISPCLRRVVIPTVIEFGESPGFGPWVILDWQDAVDVGVEWDELSAEHGAGRSIPQWTDKIIVEMIEDLRSIDVGPILPSGLERRTGEWVTERFEKHLKEANRTGVVSLPQLERARSLVKPFLDSIDRGSLTLSNHDFYWRNFIHLADRRVRIIDWDVAKLSTFETEHCVGYIWKLMWNNPVWQGSFLAKAKQQFALDVDRMRSVMLISTLAQAIVVWPTRPDLHRVQIDLFLNLLDDRYFKHVWGG